MSQMMDHAVPDHVASSRVVDFDIYGDHRYLQANDLHQGLYRLCQEAGWGILWTPRNGGHWLITDHALLVDAVRRPDLFSSTEMTVPPMPEEPLLIPLGLDPPIHFTFRLPLLKAFAPPVVRAMETGIRAVAADLIGQIAGQGHCEFVHDIAVPMPVLIFMEIMGMPSDRLEEFRLWVIDMASNDNDRRAAAYMNCHRLMEGLIRERQMVRQDDLISTLLDISVEGRQPSFDELQAYCMLLFNAGLDTVANSIALGVNHLAGNPDLQDYLRANPHRIKDAVEEFLRRFGITMPPRTATMDMEFGGAQIRKGERVVMVTQAANLDPKIFPDPMQFDIDRRNHNHVTFNTGPHHCAGSHLARAELRIFYEEWLARMPNVRHDPERPLVLHMALSFGLKKLPLVWDVGLRG